MERPLAFAETAAQWHALRAAGLPAARIVTVLPAADAAAEGSSPTVEDFCSHATLLRRGDQAIREVDALCDAIDRILRPMVTQLPRSGWVSAHAFFHVLKGLQDALLRRALPMLVAGRSLAATSLHGFELPAYEVGGLGLLDKPAWSLSSHMVPLLAASWELPLHLLPATPEPLLPHELPVAETAGADTRPRLPGQGAPVPGQPLLIHQLFGDLGDAMFRRWHEREGGAQLPFGEVFDGALAQRLRDTLQKFGPRLLRAVEQDPAVRSHFVLDDVDLWSLARPTLQRICCDGLPDLLAWAPVVDQGLTGRERTVIAMGGMMERNGVLCRGAAAHGIPVASMHFGGFIGFSHMPMHERYDLGDADRFITGGPGSERTLGRPTPQASWPAGRKRAVPVGLGTPWIESILAQRGRPRTHEGPPRILYVLSALLGDNVFLGYLFHPEIWYARLQRKLIEALAEHAAAGRCELLLKMPMRHRYPQVTNPIEDWLAQTALPGVHVYPDKPLTECLDDADAFVIDSPSTPLVQLVATDKPILAYVDQGCFLMDPHAAELMARRAIYAESEDALFAAVDPFVREHAGHRATAVDDGFLTEYVTGGAPGAAARIASCLRSLAVEGIPAGQTVR